MSSTTGRASWFSKRDDRAAHISAEAQVRRKRGDPITSVDELAFPDVCESDEQFHAFVTCTNRAAPALPEHHRPGHRHQLGR